MDVTLYNQAGEERGTITLPDTVFGMKWNADLVHQVVESQRANMRHNVAHVKHRGEVRGGGRKPWRQKGTGRARHGSIRSPLWKGGGVTHGPTKEKNYQKKVNKKMAQIAFLTVLSAKARAQEVLVLDDLLFPTPKTKFGEEMFTRFSRTFSEKIKKGNGVLVALPEKDATVLRVFRNLPYADVHEARNMNAWEVLQYKYILFPQRAIDVFLTRAQK